MEGSAKETSQWPQPPDWLTSKTPAPLGNRAQIAWISAAALIAFAALMTSQRHGAGDTAILVLLVTGAFLATIPVFRGVAYGPYTDVLSDFKIKRGACEVTGDEDLGDIVRALYQFSSYESVRTTWPVSTLFLLIGAIVSACVVRPETGWLRATLLYFFLSLVTHAYLVSFCSSHGEQQAQMYRDTLYCRYKAAEAVQAALRRYAAADSSLASA